MKGDNDWQRIPAVLTDRLVVRVSPKAVQIVFGQVGETEVSFHTAVAMTRANAEGLSKAILLRGCQQQKTKLAQLER
jgi:hypothetical protein